MRKQSRLTLGYVAVSVAAALFSPMAVETAGIDGASWIYFALMAALTLWFGVLLLLGIRKGLPSQVQ